MSRILVTGATGCIGSAAVDWLLADGVERVFALSRSAPAPQGRFPQVDFLPGDVADESRLHEVLREVRPTHVLHLAALQTPDCRDHPMRGLEVNLLGTANLLKLCAELEHPLQRFVFASSGAVYGPRALYGQEGVMPDDPYKPFSLYGYWKIAGEGMAQAFHHAQKVPTVSLRLATTYGPGRDRGFTAAATNALKAVALGLPYEIPYRGFEHYHFSLDVGAGFGCALLRDFAGYGAFNLPGKSLAIEVFLERVRQAAEEKGIADRFHVAMAPDSKETPFVYDLNADSTMKAFPDMPLTAIDQGIDKSLDYFLGAVEEGGLTPEDLS